MKKLDREASAIWSACQDLVKRPNVVQLGITLRTQRMARYVSLRTLAKRMGISAPYLSDLELGRRGWTEERVREFMRNLK